MKPRAPQLAGILNAKFTGTLTTGAIAVGTNITAASMTVTPGPTGDALVAGEPISVVPVGDLPANVGIVGARASGTNTVKVWVITNALLSGGMSVPLIVVAHR